MLAWHLSSLKHFVAEKVKINIIPVFPFQFPLQHEISYMQIGRYFQKRDSDSPHAFEGPPDFFYSRTT